MPGAPSVAVIGAGAMGTALACHFRARGSPVALLATDRDDDVVAAWRRGAPHPRLLIAFPDAPVHPHGQWAEPLAGADLVVVAVTSAGLAQTLAEAAPAAGSDVVWALATKGWEPETLRTPSEVAGAVLGSPRVVSVSGPALAAELAVGAPTGLICAAPDRAARRLVAGLLTTETTRAVTTSDVAGVETAAAFKNVVAVAVGVAEGLAGRLGQTAVASRFGNAQAAVFAAGLARHAPPRRRLRRPDRHGARHRRRGRGRPQCHRGPRAGRAARDRPADRTDRRQRPAAGRRGRGSGRPAA
jgi:glycerol-3-phosphate dehydrogenase (NAD(P)+)